ncbi:transmembrane protein 62-like [Diadema antillarum]|uniref:transmembrane protein 62-like n=1 Tax=Diadema antillarum TaxID=105358 RepID=UPI003A897125
MWQIQSKTASACAVLVMAVVACCVLAKAVHYFTIPVQYTGPPHPRSDLAPYPGDGPDNLFWFVQISDIHLTSVPNVMKATRARDFKIFCTDYLKIIQPTLVLATGDLTDGAPNSSENIEDWLMYHKVLQEAELPYSMIWLDVRGNHDNFNVPSAEHTNNLFRQYSVLGAKGDQSFLHELQLPFGTYSFIYAEALPHIGLKRPFNFFGILDDLDLHRIQALTDRSLATPSNHTIFFGHYPTNVILAPSKFHTILSNGIAYLCGHLHDLDTKKGVNEMYALQRYNSLELELADWKKHRKYRIMAFDHDLLSFTDVQFGQWPIVLITNPKAARFLAPAHEPVGKMRHSSHIRFLVFSPDQVSYANVEIDGRALGMAEAVDGGPLFVMPWKPELYGNGLHRISVTVRDSADRVGVASHQFSLDGSRPDQPFLQASIIMMNAVFFFVAVIMGLECCCVLPLLFVRRYTDGSSLGASAYPLLTGLLLLAHTSDVFFCLLIIAVYPLIGPWFLGDVLENTHGIVTLYGVYVKDTFIGDKFPMYFFAHDLAEFHIPLTLFCILHLSRAHHRLRSKQGHHNGDNPTRSSQRVADVVRVIISLFPLKVALARALQTSWVMSHWYGWLALLISPKYGWTCLVGAYVGLRCIYIGVYGGHIVSRVYHPNDSREG